MAQLYKLTEQFKELSALADSEDESRAVAVHDTLEALGGEFEEKGKAIATIVLNMSGDIEALDAEISRLSERKKAIVNRQESMKEYLRTNMDATGIKKISHPLFSITCVPGREIAVIDSESDIPDDYMRTKVECVPDKSAIAKALKEKIDIPGVHLERAKSSIRIK
jgi:hypothetical protein